MEKSRSGVVIGSVVAFAAVLALSCAALAAEGIAVTRSEDTMVYGNCVPSLVAVNASAQSIDFLQIELVLALRGGQERTIELRSGYRGGIARPIVPGATLTLHQQLDLSMPLGAACASVVSRRLGRIVCEAGSGDCAAAVTVQP